jgi:hypothetical protein
MKTRIVASLFLFGSLVGVVTGAAPPSIENSFCSLTSPMLGVVPLQTHQLFWFRDDGTFQGLVYRRSYGGDVTYSLVENGTYSYVVSSQNSNVATLTMGSRAFNLEFTTRFSASDIPPPSTGSVAQVSAGIFDFFPAIPQSGAVSISNRAWVNNQRTAITGFMVRGTMERWVLIRAAGPALRDFGIQNVVNEPELTLYYPSGASSHHGSWSAIPNMVTGLQTAFGIANAFPFAFGSRDCAALVLLSPGPYTMHCGNAESDSEVLMEAYILDFGAPAFD